MSQALSEAALVARRAHDDERRAIILEEVEFLAGTCDPDTLAQRLGYANAKSLGRLLRRWGHLDLAHRAGIHAV